jgi:uncharacterized protein YecE (DUF72 family)
MTAWIGTSGWQYADWRGAFYPQGLAQRAWLEHYARNFRTVELNASFYRLPSRQTFAGWAQRTPADFVVAVKASRYLTHMKRLREPAEPVARLLDRAGGLGAKLGPVLMQLPPDFAADLPRLAAALDAFPAGVRVAVEVRHDSWFTPQTHDLLTERNVALCLADRDARWLTPRWRTADWGYVRFHWGAGVPAPCYEVDTLAARLDEVAGLWSAQEDVFVYFNNDPQCCAVLDAARFALLCAKAGLPATRSPSLDQVRLAPHGA